VNATTQPPDPDLVLYVVVGSGASPGTQARRSVTSIPLPSGTGWLCAFGCDRAF
jgi:hypothetical protein